MLWHLFSPGFQRDSICFLQQGHYIFISDEFVIGRKFKIVKDSAGNPLDFYKDPIESSRIGIVLVKNVHKKFTTGGKVTFPMQLSVSYFIKTNTT